LQQWVSNGRTLKSIKRAIRSIKRAIGCQCESFAKPGSNIGRLRSTTVNRQLLLPASYLDRHQQGGICQLSRRHGQR
jgi:hypothetical protein